ncbi:hypothetical protein AUP74_00864 [Microbulbifer aggregans]|uniref:Uncharacterized protein n=1 Tax=Microbulbifer aggregans TaxID=1769779 RepID=A0A1C9W597_9GAMM|nr:hypothetical protein [Microbulbifer aggregans]AOS96331.1 hypothetical protein AUP74_00864 [Microbulbifer aggregans]
MNKSLILAFAFACSTVFFAFEYFRLTNPPEEAITNKETSHLTAHQDTVMAINPAQPIVPIDDYENEHEHSNEKSTYNIHDVKKELCKSDPSEHYCSINTELDLADMIFDGNLSAAKVEETGIVLQGSNYNEVMQNIVGNDSENIMKSEEFNQRAIAMANSIDPRIESSFACNPNLCLASVRAYSEQNWQDFQEAFFTGDAAGNLFILPDPHEDQVYRVLVALGNGLPVLKREN